MHLFEFAFFASGVLYALFCQQLLIFYFLLIVGAYLLIGKFIPGAKELSTRKKIMAATWSPPSEGVVLNKTTVRVEKVKKILEDLPKESRPTLTHFIIKACGELLKRTPELNGKLVFGKFVPY
eukprot:GHVR01099095.1.p1 GENE.GHVR01099095.1~~GHVR01099095.1.p1  ORF type:complete len:123 (+),score=9.52 GHVR01099095.1:1117-1485(+)